MSGGFGAAGSGGTGGAGGGGGGGGNNRADPQLQPLLGVAPLGPIPLNSDRVVQLRMLESAFKHLPQLSDSERVR